jgi:hypothetical protein
MKYLSLTLTHTHTHSHTHHSLSLTHTLKNGTVGRMFPPANGAIVALQFVREALYVGCEKKVVILNPKTEQAVDATTPCGVALVLCLLHDGERLFVGYSDCKVRAWKDGAVVGVFDRHTGPVKVLAKENHALFSGSDDQSVVRFNTNTGSATVLYQGFNGAVRALVAYKNTIYFSDGVNVRAQSVESGACLWTGTGHKSPVYALLRQNELLISSSADNCIIVRNLVTSAPYCVLAGHTMLVKCLALRGTTLYSGSSDKFVMSWDLRDILTKARAPDALAQLADAPAATATAAGVSGVPGGAPALRGRAGSALDAGGPTGYSFQQPAPGGVAIDTSHYGQMPGAAFANATPGNEQYNSVPQAGGGYGAIPHVVPDPQGGYGQVPNAPPPAAGAFQIGDGHGGYGQVPRPPLAPNIIAASSGAYGAVPSVAQQVGIEDGGPSNYSSIPNGSVGETPGYGVIPSAPGAGGSSGGNGSPNVHFDAPGYAQLPSGPGRALAASGGLPLNVPGYAQIPSGPGAGLTAAAPVNGAYATIDPRYRRDQQPGSPQLGMHQQQQTAPAPQLAQSMPGYSTGIDPRYKK